MNRAIYSCGSFFFCQKVVYLFISHMTDGNDISCSRSEMKESGNLDQPANRTKTANPIRSVRGYAIETPTQVLWLCNCCDDKNALFFSNFTASPTWLCNVDQSSLLVCQRLQVLFWRFVANLKIKKYTLPKDLRRKKRFSQRIQ